MFEWIDVTDHFSEDQRHWNGGYMEVCEVAFERIECSLFSFPDSDWEIYFDYGIMYGVSYASADEVYEKRMQMKKEIEEEYALHQMEPSDDFINTFCTKYGVDILHALF